jgi:ligand-binding SRPBCC domain-containing protein
VQIIELETKIAAPPERCFLLSLSIDLHMESTAATRERAIAGVTHGIIGPDQTVTWRGRHFGLMLTHTSLIDRYEPPGYFRDVMVQGNFRSFEHEHFFAPIAEGGTLMRDRLQFAAPFGPLGRMAERLVLRNYMLNFLRERDECVRTVAEHPSEWTRYIPEQLAIRTTHNPAG